MQPSASLSIIVEKVQENVAKAPTGHQILVGETGWPAAVGTTVMATNKGGAQSSFANLQAYLDNVVCDLNERGMLWFVRARRC